MPNNDAMAEDLQGRVPERLRKGMRTAEDYHEYLQSRISRRQVLKGIGLAGAAAAAGPVLWQRPGFAAEPPRGIHIAYGTDPMRQMNVSWFTKANVSGAVLDVGDSPAFGLTIPAESLTYANPIDPPTSIQHHVSIPGLHPGKTYHYRIRHQGGSSETFAFTTAPDRIVPVRMTSFGDHGSDPGTDVGRATWGTAYSPHAVDAIERINPAFHIHNGDISYSCGGPQLAWDEWQVEVQRRAARMPWMASLGNHEMEVGFGPRGYDPFQSRFRFPTNGHDSKPDRTSTFYSFRHSNVLCIMLDGNEAANEQGYRFNRGYWKGSQDRWLAATLKAGRADPLVDWIIVSFHNCMYCTDAVHGSDGGCRNRWQKLFERYRVDLVLNGHNHCYERTYPVTGSEFTRLMPGQPVTPEMGVTYVCAGGGGQLTVPRSASTFPTAIVHDDAGRAQIEPALWRASRFDSYSVAVIDVDPGSPGGKTTLTLSAREFATPAFAEIDRIVLERPAKAIAAVRHAPHPKPVVKGSKQHQPLPATGIGMPAAAGAALVAGAAAVAVAARDPGPEA